MKKTKMLVFMTMLLVFSSMMGSAALARNLTSDEREEQSQTEGAVASKDEVVYASLNAAGAMNEIYVVNMLDVRSPGAIIDYGNYTTVRNLTDLSEIKQVNDTVQLQASPGTFYYQGNMQDHELPWELRISYMLDGKEIAPEDLAGKDGRLLIKMEASANKAVDPVFYENYLLQISLTLDSDTASNIQAPDATIANVGKKRQVSYTVMPGNDGEWSVLADVVHFEMEGIDIAALPMSMAMNSPEIDEMTKEMQTLSEAIEQINDGVSELKTGVAELNDGAHRLNSGSGDYKSGMEKLKDSSAELLEASAAIDESLAAVSAALRSQSGEMDLGELAQLPDGLRQIADGLREVSSGLTLLKDNYSKAYSALDDAMANIPEHYITDEEIYQLYESGANRTTIDQLLEVYGAALTAKGTYDAVKQAFAAVETTLDTAGGAIDEMSDQLALMAAGLSQALEDMDGLDALSELEEGIALLASSYGEFHDGLGSYTDGVSALADVYKEIHTGLDGIADGTAELEAGVGELHNGTEEVADATKDLPDQMQDEVDAMMAEYDKSDFEAVSFVSEKNTNIGSVQFIFKTEAIEMDEDETIAEEEDDKKSFWERFLDLFS
ncbi:X-X-X-Leu-X-X-Gly heptad repeat-containing protein [Evansella caseinilytica]|uniref:X-X-X-Leu-X-X-Gly heptad repeat-containing protein n=1 Tax=Evansella caseinilytica TaxID=1503961 RepID=A0A1H3I456_9BACI|nr:hypothetical protein [Evansella caseinilytica]SDY22450.1 X-X-X-Leu-X-X-Gly heptad repeat-containing protein [Evansella caseinilytica]